MCEKMGVPSTVPFKQILFYLDLPPPPSRNRANKVLLLDSDDS